MGEMNHRYKIEPTNKMPRARLRIVYVGDGTAVAHSIAKTLSRDKVRLRVKLQHLGHPRSSPGASTWSLPEPGTPQKRREDLVALLMTPGMRDFMMAMRAVDRHNLIDVFKSSRAAVSLSCFLQLVETECLVSTTMSDSGLKWRHLDLGESIQTFRQCVQKLSSMTEKDLLNDLTILPRKKFSLLPNKPVLAGDFMYLLFENFMKKNDEGYSLRLLSEYGREIRADRITDFLFQFEVPECNQTCLPIEVRTRKGLRMGSDVIRYRDRLQLLSELFTDLASQVQLKCPPLDKLATSNMMMSTLTEWSGLKKRKEQNCDTSKRREAKGTRSFILQANSHHRRKIYSAPAYTQKTVTPGLARTALSKSCPQICILGGPVSVYNKPVYVYTDSACVTQTWDESPVPIFQTTFKQQCFPERHKNHQIEVSNIQEVDKNNLQAKNEKGVQNQKLLKSIKAVKILESNKAIVAMKCSPPRKYSCFEEHAVSAEYALSPELLKEPSIKEHKKETTSNLCKKSTNERSKFIHFVRSYSDSLACADLSEEKMFRRMSLASSTSSQSNKEEGEMPQAELSAARSQRHNQKSCTLPVKYSNRQAPASKPQLNSPPLIPYCCRPSPPLPSTTTAKHQILLRTISQNSATKQKRTHVSKDRFQSTTSKTEDTHPNTHTVNEERFKVKKQIIDNKCPTNVRFMYSKNDIESKLRFTKNDKDSRFISISDDRLKYTKNFYDNRSKPTKNLKVLRVDYTTNVSDLTFKTTERVCQWLLDGEGDNVQDLPPDYSQPFTTFAGDYQLHEAVYDSMKSDISHVIEESVYAEVDEVDQILKDKGTKASDDSKLVEAPKNFPNEIQTSASKSITKHSGGTNALSNYTIPKRSSQVSSKLPLSRLPIASRDFSTKL